MAETSFDLKGRSVRVGQLYTALKAVMPTVENLATTADGKLRVSFTGALPEGVGQKLLAAVRDHREVPETDPDDDVLSALGAAATVADLKSAFVAWVRARKRA